MPPPVGGVFIDARYQTRDNTPTGGFPHLPAHALKAPLTEYVRRGAVDEQILVAYRGKFVGPRRHPGISLTILNEYRVLVWME